VHAKKHLQIAGQNIDMGEMLLGVVEKVEKHLENCYIARSVADWNAVVRESDAAIVAGADSAPQVLDISHFFLLLSFSIVHSVRVSPYIPLCYFVVAGSFGRGAWSRVH